MTKLKLGPLADETPVKITVEVPAQVHRDLKTYGALLAPAGTVATEPAKLIVAMAARFMATDRAFLKLRRSSSDPGT